MTKSALIRFRCEPEFKAALEREATYQQLEMSELIRRTLENYILAGASLPPSLKGHVEKHVPAPFTGTPIPVDSLEQDEASGMVAIPTVPPIADGTCEHGRPRRVCWECA